MRESKQFYYAYDLDATTYKYGRLGGPGGLPVQGKYGLETSGSSTTVTAVAGTPFDPVTALDMIVIVKGETKYTRKVATKVDGTEITIDSAVDLTGGYSGWFFYPWRIGATNADGWHQVTGYEEMTVHIVIPTVAAAGGVDVQIQGLSPNLGGSPVTLWSNNYAAATTGDNVEIGEELLALRVGVKGGSGFAGTDDINIWMTGRVRGR